jgi:hypothetical protein
MCDVLLFDRAAWAKPVAPRLATRWHRVWPDNTAISLVYLLKCLFSACITDPTFAGILGELHIFLKMCKMAFEAKNYEFHS